LREAHQTPFLLDLTNGRAAEAQLASDARSLKVDALLECTVAQIDRPVKAGLTGIKTAPKQAVLDHQLVGVAHRIEGHIAIDDVVGKPLPQRHVSLDSLGQFFRSAAGS
jgi:hypothetical protein